MTDVDGLTDHPDRHLRLDGSFNFRDLGGYPAADGRHLRWRTLFRADALSRLEPADIEIFDRLGMRSVVDLRTASEVLEGRIDHGHLRFEYHHLSVLGESWAPLDLPPDADAAEVLGSLYVEMLHQGAPALASAIGVLAEAGNVPAVFHCAAGKDRTGVLAALVLGLLGVDDEIIIADYGLSGRSMDQLVERLKATAPERLSAMNDQPSAYLAAPPGAMRRLLDHLRTEHGSVRGYADAIGVGDEVVDGLRASLLA
ncbi:MAG: tyrosine-protein phosphatase [Acidimicrobiales bacterium]|nr:tyrosine-protein phosphatase [Acidimicrobiales bacterium]